MLLEPVEEGVKAAIRVEVFNDLRLIADGYRAAEDGKLTRDHVTGITVSSLLLATLALRRPVRTVLDVGVGCGIQSLVAAGHSEWVTGTDINLRALTFAAFNARLNDVENVEFLSGSYFEPVEGRRFDLIVTNPPFVISPSLELTFRDSGLPGDSVSRDIVQKAPSFLEEGGIAHVMASWIMREAEPWWRPVERWVEGSGCDAWILLHKTEDALDSASSWAKAFHGHEPGGFTGAMDRWLAYYRELGLGGIATGAVTLRRRTGKNWFLTDEAPDEINSLGTEAVLRIFAVEDCLAELEGNDALLDERLEVVEAHRLERTLRLRDGEYQVEKTMLFLDEGVRSNVKIDPHTARLLAFCDGTRPLREFVHELTADLGMSHEETAAQVVPVARRLIELCFLLPADRAS